VRTWLLGIARNVFRSWLRRRRPDAALDEELEWGGSDDSEGLAVRDALSRLDIDDQEILVLRYVEGLPSKEIATVFGISDAAARQRVARAADLFRELWSNS
jgi:RNA polymerase sigma-70 factor (ECF subfamily)